MKINSKLFLLTTLLIVISLDSVLSAGLKTESNLSALKSTSQTKGGDGKSKQFKVLALNSMLKNNKMDKLNFKLISLSRSEAVFYEAKNPDLATPEPEDCTKNYLFTQLFHQIQLPCFNKSLVCTIGQFLREYKNSSYKEINFDIPKEIVNMFTNPREAESKCLVVTYDSFNKMADNIFICHKDINTVNEIQFLLSKKVRDVYNKNTEIFVDYLPNMDARGQTSGILRLDNESLKFIAISTKKVEVEIPYKDIETFPFSYFNREPWSVGNDDKHYYDRCFKIPLNTGVNQQKTFCVFYSPGDFTQKSILLVHRARWLAMNYPLKIIRKILPTLLAVSIENLTKLKDSLEVDSREMIPAIYSFWGEYMLKSFEKNKVTKDNKTRDQVNMKTYLSELRQKLIESTCKNISLCVRAIKYKISKKFVPLVLENNKWAMEVMNPYIPLYPNRNIKVDNVEDGTAKEIVNQISNLKGVENFFTEELNIAPGGVPEFKQILEAFKITKESVHGRKISKVSEIAQCDQSSGPAKNLSRKMGLLPYFVPNDFLFNFLGAVGAGTTIS
jgi:hypothetical protein